MDSAKVALPKPRSSPTREAVEGEKHLEKPALPDTPCDSCVEASSTSSREAPAPVEDDDDEEEEEEDGIQSSLSQAGVEEGDEDGCAGGRKAAR